MYRTKRDLLVNIAFKPVIIKKPKISKLLFLIIGLLRHSDQLATTFISKLYQDFYAKNKKMSPYFADKAINFLIAENIIYQIPTTIIYSNKNMKWKPSPYKSREYKFTQKGRDLDAQNKRYFHTLSDMLNFRYKVDQTNKKYLEKYSSKLAKRPHYHKQWKEILNNNHFENFIPALSNMEQQKLIFDIDTVLIDNIKNRYPLILAKDLLKRKHFTVKYAPLTTGRLSSKPHIYIRKIFRRYILPAKDPMLIKGSIFNYDYSANELRILASLIKNKRLIEILNDEKSDPWLMILNELNLPYNAWNVILNPFPTSERKKMKRQFIKNIFLSCQYGSIGSGSVNHIFNNLKKRKIYIKKKIISEVIDPIFKKINEKFPEINQYLNYLIDEYKKTGHMDLIDGIQYVRPRYKKGKRKGQLKPLKFSILNHKIQSIAAAILRRVIIAGQDLEYSEILYPVHDEVVFYCPEKSKHEEAKKEAAELMRRIGKELIGDVVPMIATMEWENLGC